MTPKQFANEVAGTRMNPDGAATRAARMVLVEGMTRGAAAREVGIDVSAVSRAVARLQPGICPTCGRALPENPK